MGTTTATNSAARANSAVSASSSAARAVKIENIMGNDPVQTVRAAGPEAVRISKRALGTGFVPSFISVTVDGKPFVAQVGGMTPVDSAKALKAELNKGGYTLHYRRMSSGAEADVTLSISRLAAPKPPPAPKTVELGIEHNGQTVRVKPGQPVRVSLSEPTTAGYQWQVKVDKNLGAPKSSSKPGGPGIGAATTRQFTWATSSPFSHGKHTVVFELRRPWEQASVKPAQRASITFDIR